MIDYSPPIRLFYCPVKIVLFVFIPNGYAVMYAWLKNQKSMSLHRWIFGGYDCQMCAIKWNSNK